MISQAGTEYITKSRLLFGSAWYRCPIRMLLSSQPTIKKLSDMKKKRSKWINRQNLKKYTPIRIIDFRGTYKGGGGPDKTILHSAAQHNKKNVDVLVTYLRQPHDKEFQISNRARKLQIKYTDVIDRRLLDLHCINSIKQIIIKKQIELVHSHDDKTLLYSVILKYLIPGLRIIHTCHSHSEYPKESFPSVLRYSLFLLRKKIQLWLIQQHRYPILTISEDTKGRLIRGGLSPTMIKVLYNGIDIDQWQPDKGKPILREELHLTKNDFLIGTVARITHDKDLPTFLKIAKNLIKNIPHVKFVIVGDGYGDELERVKRNAIETGLKQNIIFTGHRSDLLDIYTSFDLFLMTSLTEGLPNTLLEAMAMQLPIVSTNVGGIPELIRNQREGILCHVGDVDKLTDAIYKLYKNPITRRELGNNARNRIEKKFNFAKRVSMLEEIYLQHAKKKLISQL